MSEGKEKNETQDNHEPGPDDPKTGIIKIVSQMIREYSQIAVSQIRGFFPGVVKEEWAQGEKGTIVMIPGFAETPAFLGYLAENLHAEGYGIYFPEGFSRFGGIEVIGEKILAELADNNILNPILVGHSKGGLVILDILHQTKDPSTKVTVGKAITIATPFGGSPFAKLRILGLHEMLPGSPVLERLTSNTKLNEQVTVLYPSFDNHVWSKR